jgi:hypothetical protein
MLIQIAYKQSALEIGISEEPVYLLQSKQGYAARKMGENINVYCRLYVDKCRCVIQKQKRFHVIYRHIPVHSGTANSVYECAMDLSGSKWDEMQGLGNERSVSRKTG